MKSKERKAWVCGAAKHATGGLFGCVLALGAGVNLQDTSSPSIASAPPPAGMVRTNMVFQLTFSKAHARGTKKTRRRDRRIAAQRKAEEKRREEADKKLEGTRRATLPAGCAYDSYASFSSTSDIHVCGGVYYQRYEEDGVMGYEGHAIGVDHEEVKRAKARRAEAEIRRRGEAEKKPQATGKAALSTDCEYDSYASFTSISNVYTCGGVQYRQYQENGVTGYERHAVGSNRGATKEAKARRAEAERRRRAEPRKKLQATRKATLPKGCVYDTYASFFTSSNVYACAGVRYRQYEEKGVTGFEVLNL